MEALFSAQSTHFSLKNQCTKDEIHSKGQVFGIFFLEDDRFL